MFLIGSQFHRPQWLSEGVERNLMATRRKSLFWPLASVCVTISSPLCAQDTAPIPSPRAYQDVGRGAGMEWSYHIRNGKPLLEFGVKETGHRLDRLWEFSCASDHNGRAIISNTIFARSPELQNNDQFGFSIRVDNGKSIGLIARKDPFEIQGHNAYFPRFDMSATHILWDALRRGERAFVNLSDNRFSLHLEGSGKAIKKFLDACRKSAARHLLGRSGGISVKHWFSIHAVPTDETNVQSKSKASSNRVIMPI
ncbi:hypothetical protein [Parasphingorhabdus sp.]|uniref:hypothetical protein n=1 Tax=Parasphingorhabdus sp. TaxID=2709688 RepID=UPI003C7217E4